MPRTHLDVIKEAQAFSVAGHLNPHPQPKNRDDWAHDIDLMNEALKALTLQRDLLAETLRRRASGRDVPLVVDALSALQATTESADDFLEIAKLSYDLGLIMGHIEASQQQSGGRRG